MKISDILKHQQSGFSFEFFPPKTDVSVKSLRETISALRAYQPLYISMTCGAGGTTQANTQRAVDILLEEGGLAVMPHLTCLDAEPGEIEEQLDHYKRRGIEN